MRERTRGDENMSNKRGQKRGREHRQSAWVNSHMGKGGGKADLEFFA